MEKLMELIRMLHANDMGLAKFWKAERDFWFAQHKEKDRRYWKERERRIAAEDKLKEMKDDQEM